VIKETSGGVEEVIILCPRHRNKESHPIKEMRQLEFRGDYSFI
jgi:hypothetical protein